MKKTLQEEKERFRQIVEATNMAYGFKPNENDVTEQIPEPDLSEPEKGYQVYHENKEFRDFLGKILWEMRPQDRNDGTGYSVYADRVAAALEKKYPKLKKIIGK